MLTGPVTGNVARSIIEASLTRTLSLPRFESARRGFFRTSEIIDTIDISYNPFIENSSQFSLGIYSLELTLGTARQFENTGRVFDDFSDPQENPESIRLTNAAANRIIVNRLSRVGINIAQYLLGERHAESAFLSSQQRSENRAATERATELLPAVSDFVQTLASTPHRVFDQDSSANRVSALTNVLKDRIKTYSQTRDQFLEMGDTDRALDFERSIVTAKEQIQILQTRLARLEYDENHPNSDSEDTSDE